VDDKVKAKLHIHENYIYMKNIIIIVKANKISKLQKLITWYLSGSIRIY